MVDARFNRQPYVYLLDGWLVGYTWLEGGVAYDVSTRFSETW